jgi:hypothetical protein
MWFMPIAILPLVGVCAVLTAAAVAAGRARRRRLRDQSDAVVFYNAFRKN